MSKDTMISFRTTAEFSKTLKRFAKKNKVTLSGFIDAVLQDYLQSQNGQDKLPQERRKFPREHRIIPAIISGPGDRKAQFHASKITSLSLGGMSLVVPKNGGNGGIRKDVLEDFEVIFSLPQEGRPITIQCQSRRVLRGPEGHQVGASFDDADLDSYQALQGYLF